MSTGFNISAADQAAAAEASQSIGMLPDGFYNFTVESERWLDNTKTPADKTKRTWEMTLIVYDGPHKGRKVWKTLYGVAPGFVPKTEGDTTARNISNGFLLAWCAACGKTTDALGNVQGLMAIPFSGKVKTKKGGPKPDGGNYDDKSEMRDPKPFDSSLAATQQAIKEQAAAAAGAAAAAQAPGTATAAGTGAVAPTAGAAVPDPAVAAAQVATQAAAAGTAPVAPGTASTTIAATAPDPLAVAHAQAVLAQQQAAAGQGQEQVNPDPNASGPWGGSGQPPQ